MNMLLAGWIPVMVLGLTACSDSSPGGHSNVDGRIGTLREEVRIDGYTEGLVPVSALSVADDGRVAVFQEQENGVRFYSAAGQSLGLFGRPGDGPGDFAFLGHMGWRADTLWVYDVSHRRVTHITPELELSRIEPNILERVYGIDPEGRPLTQHGVVDWPQRILRLNVAEPLEVSLLELPVVPANSASVRTSVGRVVLPFANLPIVGFASDGSRVAGAMANLDGPDSETFSLTVVGYQGDTIFDRRYSFGPSPISPLVADSVIEERVAIGERPGASAALRSWAATIRAATRVPRMWPPLVALLVGNDGTIWVQLRERQGSKPYYVVSATGDPVGTVFAPEGSRFGAAALDWVWSIEADEVGVESLVRYSLAWE